MPDDSELDTIFRGKRYKLSLTKAVSKRLAKADARFRVRIGKWMESYSEDGRMYLDDTKMKKEGDFPVGRPGVPDVGIYAFKAYQLRVYGGVVDGNHFIATEIELAKKKDQADQKKLARAAKKLAPYV